MPGDPPDQRDRPTPPPRETPAQLPNRAAPRHDPVAVQAEHRHALERMRVEGEERRNDRAQWLSFAVAVLGLVISGALGYFAASTWLAGIIAVVAVGGPSTATVLARVLDRQR